MQTTLIAASAKADKLAEDVSFFWFSNAGKRVNKLEEFSLLVEWLDAISDAIAQALNARSWVDVQHFDKMKDECIMWLELTQEQMNATNN